MLSAELPLLVLRNKFNQGKVQRGGCHPPLDIEHTVQRVITATEPQRSNPAPLSFFLMLIAEQLIFLEIRPNTKQGAS